MEHYGKGSTGTTAYGATTDAVIGGILNKARVVSAGFRIRSISALNAVSGRLQIAPVLIQDGCEFNDALLTAIPLSSPNIQNISALLVGTAMGGSTPVNVLSFPGSFEVALDQLIDRDLCFQTRAINPKGLDFRNCGASNPTLLSGAYEVLDDSAVAVTSTGAVSTTYTQTSTQMSQCGGMMGFVVSFSNVGNNGPPIELEYIYHVEGQQDPGLSTSITPIYSNSQGNRNSRISVEMVLAEIAESPLICARAPLLAGLAGIGNRMMSAITRPTR
jgi:hypothetical protein